MFSKLLILTALIVTSNLAFGADKLDDKGFQKLMKEVGDAAKRFKGGIDGKDHAQVSKDAGRISEIYNQMTPFWQQHKADKAVTWSKESSVAASTLAASAKAQDWDKVKTDMQGLMKNCKACHDAHREKLDDGSYRIKF